MKILHAQLLPAVFRALGSLLAFTAQTAAGELGTSSATRDIEAQANQANPLAV
jgi:hypothetical protein